MDSSHSANLRAAKTLSAQAHQLMFASILTWINVVAMLLPAPPKPRFRRYHSTSSKKKHKKDWKLSDCVKARSDRDILQTNTDDIADAARQQSPYTLFHEVVERCREFMATFSKTHKFVFHLASMRRMYLDLASIGSKLELTVAYAGLTDRVKAEMQKKDSEWNWKKRLDGDREKEEAELSAKAAKNALPFARNMLPHEPMEALTLLKFEIDFFKPGNTVKHVASMKKVFFSVVRSSNGRVAKIPNWYIPPYAMNYSRELVLLGSVGTAHRGIWIDRKPTDGKKSEKDEGGGEQPPKTYKVVVKRLFIHADAIEFFRQEVEIWFAMDHPNVLKLYGASHCSRPALLVCEDATNGSLLEYLTRQRLQVDKRRKRDEGDQPWPYRNQRHALWSLFLQAANGLKYLHESYKLVHGNLKSDNILVTSDGQVKLTDFGLGMLALQNQAAQDKKFKELGWRAPNCWKDKKLLRRPSFQDDIYSFGLCVLDVLVPTRSSIMSEDKIELKRVGDEEFDPLDKSVLELVYNESHRKLIEDMCQLKSEDRLKLADVTKRMEEMRDAATREPVDSSDCCML